MGVAGGVNVYRFNGGNPVSFGDPFGLCPFCFSAAIGAVSGVVTGFLVAKATGADFGLREAAVDAGLGAVGGAVSSLGKLRNAVRGAQAGAAGFATKSAARATLAEMALPEVQAVAVNSAIGRATTKTVIGITQGEGGNVVVTLTRGGRNGRQVIESVIAPDGTKSVVKKAFDEAGRLVHFDPKN